MATSQCTDTNTWNTNKLRASGQDALINKAYKLDTYCDWQNYTIATWDWSYCTSECCITNTHLLVWIKIHKASFLPVTVICTGDITQDVHHHLKSFWDWTPWHYSNTFTAICTTLLYSMSHLDPICNWYYFWPTHFSAHLCSIRPWFLKAASKFEQPRRDTLVWLPSIMGFHSLSMACTGKWIKRKWHFKTKCIQYT